MLKGLEWFNADKTIIIQTLPVRWDIDTIYLMIDEWNAMVQSVSHDVHAINDFSYVEDFNGNLMQMSTYASKNAPTNIGERVFVKPPQMISLFIPILQRLNFPMAQGIHIAKTVDGALGILQQEGVKI